MANPFDSAKRDHERLPFLTSTNEKVSYHKKIRDQRLARKRMKELKKATSETDPKTKDDQWYEYINESRSSIIDFEGRYDNGEPPTKKRKLSTPSDQEISDMAMQSEENDENELDFVSLKVSRVILKAIRDLGWKVPTPVQTKAIPPALMGKDLFINAVTGSGKTAAFMIPVLERLLFTTDRTVATRVLVVTPTRELAAQCLTMTNELSKYSPVTIGLVVGGLDVEAQEVALRRKPDIVICTPGRMIDLVRNSRGVTLDEVEILVLDEADRLLDMGFSQEIEELVSHLPKERQTVLLSATLTDDVFSLAQLSLNEPEKIAVDPSLCLAQKLTQEFVRVPQGHEKLRYAMLLALCLKHFTASVIVFCRTKKETHLLRLMFGLMGLRAAELHGNMSQLDRLDALKAFRERSVDYLLCTDVAARGIDIEGVQAVINLEFPTNIKTYIHRVGRTARAGCNGHAVTLVGEQRKKLLKTLINSSSKNNNMKSRIINPDFVEWCNYQITDMKGVCKSIIIEEQNEREMRLSDILINKSQNMLKHGKEIFNKPRKEWHLSKNDRDNIKKNAHFDDLGEEFASEMKEKINRKIEETILRKKQMESGLSAREIKEQERRKLDQMSKLDKERLYKKQQSKFEQEQRRKELKLSQTLASQAMAEQRRLKASKKESKLKNQKETKQNRKRKYIESKKTDRLAGESSKEMRKLHSMTKAKSEIVRKKVVKSSKKKKYADRRK